MPGFKPQPVREAISGEAMDRVIERRFPWKRVAIGSAAVLLVGAGIWFLLIRPGSERSLTVEGTHIVTAAVVRGRFEDIVEVRGRVTPLRTIYLDTASGGQVEAILVEDGAHVERGQLLVELSNTTLQLDLISREAQITEQMNNLRGLELAHEESRLAHQREMVEIDYNITRLERSIGRAERLVNSGGSARSELEDQRDELAYYRRRRQVQLDTRASADRLQRAQLTQLRASAQQLEKNLEIARRNLDSLKVKAPGPGRLSAFSLEVGQSLAVGDRIAQIDDPDHYKVVADVDEFYLSRVDIGQRAEYPEGGTTYELTVAKIRPQVQNGQFQTELTFTGAAPTAIRRGQTAQLRLQLGQPSEALLVPNGAFFHDTGGTWVFVVSGDHRHAVRRNVRLGRRNPRQIEVLDGLSAGEEIVTSSYTNYLDLDRLELSE